MKRNAGRRCCDQLVSEAHLMIKLTALSTEEEPHSTIAAFLVAAGPALLLDSYRRLAHLPVTAGPIMIKRTMDHSYVQRLVDEGQITEDEAISHPQSNLLTGCLGTVAETRRISTEDQIENLARDRRQPCSAAATASGTTTTSAMRLGTVVHSLPPREAAELLISKARQRAKRWRRQPLLVDEPGLSP